MKSQLIVLMLLLYIVDAVKIGISKIDMPTTAFNATTQLTTQLSEEGLSTPIPTEDVRTTTTTTKTPTKSSTTTSTKTTFPSFAVPTFPTKKTKTVVISNKVPRTTSTTTTEVSLTDNDTELKMVANTTGSAEKKVSDENYYCHCDLLPKSCDINCCCDPDCSNEALDVFNCYVESEYPEWRMRWEGFHYQHGLPSCRINDGWLCVLRTNTHPQREKINPNMDTAAYYKWPLKMLQGNEEVDRSSTVRNFYKYGEPLKMLNLETLEIQNFVLPYAFRPPYCHINTQIRHLKPYKATCLIGTIEELQEQTRKLLQMVTTTNLLVKPKETDSPEQYLKEMRIKRCYKKDKTQQGKQTCYAIKMDNLTNELDTENYFATEITIQIIHNYTSILAGIVELRERELSSDETELWQSYAVEFIYKNLTEIAKNQINLELEDIEKLTATVLTSGPLGYLQGEPLIIAHFIAQNSSHPQGPQNQVLNYFHPNETKARQNHTIQLFTRRLRLCHKNEEKENYVRYGISTYKQCELRLGNVSELLSDLDSTNFTAICVRLQNRVLEYLIPLVAEETENEPNFERLSELYISQLGKPVNASDKWTQLHLRNADFAPVSGRFNKDAQSFTCRNILLSAAYEFQIGTFLTSIAAVPHQALVRDGALVLGQRHDLEFTLDEMVAVPLSVSVMFYDLNSVGIGTAGAKPSIQICNYVFNVLLVFILKCSN